VGDDAARWLAVGESVILRKWRVYLCEYNRLGLRRVRSRRYIWREQRPDFLPDVHNRVKIVVYLN
jgi:hypothetical protein